MLLERRLSCLYPIETHSRAGGLRMPTAPAFVRCARRDTSAARRDPADMPLSLSVFFLLDHRRFLSLFKFPLFHLKIKSRSFELNIAPFYFDLALLKIGLGAPEFELGAPPF